uniref:Uncharacterized protein n=1 Tax=Lepeophtheirus salmonis TaxID=72036 RepID=A0A0K2TJ54_LEPSM
MQKISTKFQIRKS